MVPFSCDWTSTRPPSRATGLKLFYLANPDSPSGTAIQARARLPSWRSARLPLVVDEAYADFADRSPPPPCSKDHPNVIVTRSFSKGYSLAGIRLGYLVARAEVVEQLIKVKDSYNCDTLSQVAGVAALDDQDYLTETACQDPGHAHPADGRAAFDGLQVPESQANFVWATGGPPAETLSATQGPKDPGRLMAYPGYPEGLRISVGTDAEIDQLLEAARQMI